jgi:hypothetical protein
MIRDIYIPRQTRERREKEIYERSKSKEGCEYIDGKHCQYCGEEYEVDDKYEKMNKIYRDEHNWCAQEYEAWYKKKAEKKKNKLIPKAAKFITFTHNPEECSNEDFKFWIERKFKSKELDKGKVKELFYVFEHEQTNIHCHVYLEGTIRPEWSKTTKGNVKIENARKNEEIVKRYFSKENKYIVVYTDYKKII